MVDSKKLTAPFNTILVNDSGVMAQLDNQQGATALRYKVSNDTLTRENAGTKNYPGIPAQRADYRKNVRSQS